MMRVFLLSVAVVALCAQTATAGDCCSQPACCDSCDQQLTCKVVCEMKKVKKHVWVVECEPICIAKPGCKPTCGACQTGCSDIGCDTGDYCGCGKCDPCDELRNRPMVKPKCDKIRYRKKLVKKEIVCEVPTYKCVPAPCCSACGYKCGSEVQDASPPKEEKSAIRSAPLPPRVGRLIGSR